MVTLVAPIFNPSDYKEDEKIICMPDIPLGVMVLSSLLDREKIDNNIIDLSCLALRDKITNDNYMEYSYKKLKEQNSDIYSFSVTITNLPYALELAERLKKEKNCKIIMGGPGVTSLEHDILKEFDFIDVISTGEGDLTYTELIRTLEKDGDLSKIGGLTYRNENSEIVSTPVEEPIKNLDELPIPAYEKYFPILKEIKDKTGLDIAFPLDIGRGCYGQCTFCTTACYFDRNVRYKSAERIVKEITELSEKFGVDKFDIQHDCFVWNKNKVHEVAQLLKQNGCQCNFSVSARADLLDDKVKQDLDDMNVKTIKVGIETGSQRMQKILKKYLNVPKSVKTIIDGKDEFDFRVNFIIGFPEEKLSDVEETFSRFLELKKAGVNTNIGVFSPLPGCEIVNNRGTDSLNYDGAYSVVLDSPIKQTKEFHKKYKKISSPYYYYDNENGIERDLFMYYSVVSSLINLDSKNMYDIETYREIYNNLIAKGNSLNKNFLYNSAVDGIARKAGVDKKDIDEFADKINNILKEMHSKGSLDQFSSFGSAVNAKIKKEEELEK